MNKIKIAAVEKAVKNYSSHGLTSAQANKILNKYGKNTFKKEKTTVFKTFFKQLINPLSFILLFAAALSIFMDETTDALVIFIIVIFNTVLGFIQEYRSGKAVEKLSTLIQQNVSVIRDNKQISISTNNLVPGDTVLLKNGDIVPADLKIMESYNLSVNESQLTGESTSITKSHKDSNTEDTLLYTGSVIEKGHCKCVVYATGNQTSLGKISKLSKDTKKTTPYQKSLSEFSNNILKIIGATIIFMLVIKGFTIHDVNDFAKIVIFAIALAMTVLPEALPVITTITLSSGSLKLAKHNVIAKRLSAVEDLGRINILCTDKTGTLTKDNLIVKDIVSNNKKFFQELAYSSIEDLSITDQNCAYSFDRAFLEYIPASVKNKVSSWRQIINIPFDPQDRRRRCIIKNPNKNKYYLVVIGAPETLLDLSLSTDNYDYRTLMKEAGMQGVRQLGIAYKEINFNKDFDILTNENNLIFLGFAKLIDPLRETTKDTINDAKELGVNVKILTGDSLEVATFIGKEVGLLSDGQKVYSGSELNKMTPKEFHEAVNSCPIFAKVTPEEKYNIIKELKINNTVGYQGDGINDAPSLKLADVSIAVHNATDVAKASSDIVLTQDNLNVIINGIKYGRSIFVNINKYIKHAMIGNLGNFFSMVFFFLGFAADVPMLAIQLLIGNIIQDLPLMTVFSDSVDEDEIKKPQVSSQMKSVIKTSINLGIFTALYYFIFFLYIGAYPTPLTQTTLFLFYNFTQLMIVISVRSKKHYFWQGCKPSLLMLCAIGFFIALSISLTYIPFTANFMGFVPLPVSNFLTLSIISISYIVLLDFAKVSMYKVDSLKKFLSQTL